jgi:hypothetical protein
MTPRSAQLVQRVALDGLDLPALARRYGVTERSALMMLSRAVRELDGALEGRPSAPLPFEVEQDELPGFLEGWRRGASLGPAASLVAAVSARDALSATLAAQAAAEESSPRRRYEGALRWLAIAAIAALSGYLYWRDQARRAPTARPPAHPKTDAVRPPAQAAPPEPPRLPGAEQHGPEHQ